MALGILIKKAADKYRAKGIKGVLFGFNGFLARNKNKLIQIYYTEKVRNTSQECGEGLQVVNPSEINNRTKLGKQVHFRDINIRGDGPVEIKDNFEGGPDIFILTRNHKYDSGNRLPFPANSYKREKVTIEENVWIGAKVIILPGVTIGEGSVIQAGSVVVNDIPPCSIAGGHPAKVFDERDKERYYSLKNSKKN